MKEVLAAVMGTQSTFAQSGDSLSKHPQADYQSGLKNGAMDGKDSCPQYSASWVDEK